jgi:transposase
VKLQHLRCAGIDVHKRRVTVCVRIVEEGVARIEIREFGTTAGELLELCDWLKENRIPSLAMESTGSYWKPLYNLMEGDFQILLANAQHMKAVPGRKTDTKDAEWISELYAHGLLRASFVPNVEQRGMRELTRTRASLVGERARLANRIQKVLEDANIKLASVAANVLGVSGRVMLKAIIDGEEDPKAISELARGLLRKKIPELEQAVQGRVRPHHRIVLRELLKQVESLDDSVRVLEKAIEEAMADSDRPFETGVSLLCTIPGVAEVGARSVLAELGTDMDQFPSERHISSWVGVAPGNHESAGKRLSGRTTAGNAWVKRCLVQMAHAAAKAKNSYFQSMYRRLARRIGRKRAIVAVAHALLVAMYHMLKDGVPYEELGEGYFDQLNAQKTVKHLLDRLAKLGVTVQVQEAAV